RAARQTLQQVHHRGGPRECLGIPRPELAAQIEFLPLAELVADRPLVEPGPCLNGRREGTGGDGLERLIRSVQPCSVIVAEGLRIALTHAPEASELALRTIPLAVVVAIFRGELAA